MASSPYANRGVLWTTYRKHYGRHDARVLVWKAGTSRMKPTINPAVIEAAREEDPASASSEYNAQFRDDVGAFIAHEVVESCVIARRLELPPLPGVFYVAFVDPSGGSADSMTLAIAHRSGEYAVLDALGDIPPPFSPESVVRDFAALSGTYRVSTVTGDRYAGEWPRERFREHGINYEVSERVKSDISRDVLTILNSGKVELLDIPRLVNQLCGLERRTAR